MFTKVNVEKIRQTTLKYSKLSQNFLLRICFAFVNVQGKAKCDFSCQTKCKICKIRLWSLDQQKWLQTCPWTKSDVCQAMF